MIPATVPAAKGHALMPPQDVTTWGEGQRHVMKKLAQCMHATFRRATAPAAAPNGESHTMKYATTLATSQRSAGKPVTHFRFGGPATASASIKNLLAEVERLQAVVTSQHDLISKLHAAANRDELTALANRRGMETALSAALADFHRYGHTGAVLLIDLNGFKTINDTYGHAAGDALLQHVAATLRHNVRESDTVARLGGDEFVVILREVGAREANGKALELRHLLAGLPCKLGDVSLRAAASIGVATFAEAPDARDILSLADQRMYLAKQALKTA